MHIFVDQSNKVENTGNSAWAFSNSKEFAVLISAKLKRQVFEEIRLSTKSKSRKIATLKFFAIGTILLIEDDLPRLESITIDREYEGESSERIIKEFLLTYIHRRRPRFHNKAVIWGKVDRKSRPHQLAYAVYKGQRKPDKVIGIKDVRRILKGK